jgi:pimeloyl-ACP methyl ester carboxylesterase
MSRALHPIRRVGIGTGISVAFRERGLREGQTVLLVHAWGESIGSFDLMAAALPDRLHVLAVDLRGHGQSDKPLSGYDVVSVAEDVRAFLDEVDASSVVLVGSSSGGYVAQQLAVLAPDRVDGLVLLGSPMSLHGRASFADEIDALIDPISDAWARDFVGWFDVEGDVPAEYLADRVQDALALPADVWRLSLSGLTASPPPLRSGRITCAVLAIWGDRDALIPAGDQLELVAAVPGARRRVYDGVGHLVLWEQPERVAGDVAEFVAALAAGALPPESS